MIMESEGAMMIGNKEKAFVSVRIRPLNDEEITNNDVSDWECINQNTILCKNFSFLASEKSMYPTSYTFDRVFRDDCSTLDVYEQGVKDVVLSVVNGVNSNIFVYGKPRSGKTYTLKGIIVYTIADIYDYLEKHPERDFVLKLSALGVSCDSALDPAKGKMVEIFKEETLRERDHATQLVSSFLEEKWNGEALVNETSPLSQHIIRLTVESSEKVLRGKGNNICTLAASLDFVDLAAIEHTTVDDCSQMNHGLPHSEGDTPMLSKEYCSHFPSRDSVLMGFLHISHRENARTALICTMSPARSCIEEAHDTLLFAQCTMKMSANVQVNVTVKDKAVVRRLKKEVARLESELRNSQSSNAIIIKKKDTQIDRLEKEIKALILQRDIAQSQVKECLDMLEGDARAAMQMEPRDYPQIRVQASPDSEIQDLEAFMLCRSSSRDHFAKVLYSEGHSGITAGPRALISSPHSSDYECAGPVGDEIELQSNHIAMDECRELHYISHEGAPGSSFSYSVPRFHAEAHVTNSLPEFSPPMKDSASMKSDLKDDDEVKGSVTSSSTSTPNGKKYSSIQYLDIASLEIQPSRHRLKMDGVFLKLTRCKSCTESISRETASPLKMSEYKRFEKETEIGQIEIHVSEEAPCEEILSRKYLQMLPEITLDSEINTPNAKVEDGSSKEGEHTALNVTEASANKDELRGLTSWPIEFKRLQREIIQLWHVYNISLAHRTYFFLLFRGDPADAIYMELEIRRIKFLEDKSPRGVTAKANLSASALRQERRMLSHQMSKKFSEQERESLFLEWGIDLNTKVRRLKLAHQVWSKTDSIDHATRSAYLVAKLLGFIEPGHLPSEDIFNLKLAPKSRMGICSFKSSLMSVL